MPFQQSPRSRPTVSPLHYIHHNKQYFGGLLQYLPWIPLCLFRSLMFCLNAIFSATFIIPLSLTVMSLSALTQQVQLSVDPPTINFIQLAGFMQLASRLPYFHSDQTATAPAGVPVHHPTVSQLQRGSRSITGLSPAAPLSPSLLTQSSIIIGSTPKMKKCSSTCTVSHTNIFREG